MIKGTPKFDGLAVTKMELDFIKNPIHIEVSAAFVNSKTGDTHGWTRSSGGWSEETRALIKQLREAMERDMASSHLTDADTAAPTTGKAGITLGPTTGGLGEHLGDVDATSV